MICPHCKKKIPSRLLTASEAGKKGGQVSSEKKKLAARENIKKRWEKYKKEKSNKIT